MKILATLFIFVHTFVIAQDTIKELDVKPYETTTFDTIFATTEPVAGFKSLKHQLEETLSEGDTLGKKHLVRIDNIGFIVSKNGKVDSAWVIFHRRPIHYKIIKQLKATRWKAAEKDGTTVVSRQELHLNIFLTKTVLKKHGYWPSVGERLFAPWIN